MRSLVAVALVAAAASTASAGPGYLGLGIGTAASASGDLTNTSADGNRTGRLFGGARWDRYSVEGAISRYGIFEDKTVPFQGTRLAVAGKYSLPLGDQFEAFGRLGLQRTWLSTDRAYVDYAGNGWLLGAGFEYRLNVAGHGASLFVDYEYAGTSLVNQRDMKTTKSEGVGMWTLGATIAL